MPDKIENGLIDIKLHNHNNYCLSIKSAPRVPISAADVAKLLETVGVDRVIAVDLHCG